MRCSWAILIALKCFTVAVVRSAVNGNAPVGSLTSRCPIQQEGEQEFCANESDSLSSEAKKIYLHLSSEFPAATHGKLFLSLRHESAELEMSIEDITSDACTRAMQKFSIAAKLKCIRVFFREDPMAATYAITFDASGLNEEEVVYPSAREFACTLNNGRDKSTAATCLFEDAHQPVPHRTYSNSDDSHDYVSGVCISEDGLHGKLCGKHDDKGTLLRLVANRGSSKDFNLIKAEVGNIPLLTMTGDGDTTLKQGSLYLQTGDLTLLRGGRINMSSGGEFVVEKGSIRGNESFLGLTHSGEAQVESNQLALFQLGFSQSEDRYPHPLDYLHLKRRNASVVQFRSNGSLVLHEGGLVIKRGGATISHGGLQVESDGICVREGGLNIDSGDLKFDHGSLRVDNGTGFFRKTTDSSRAVLRLEYNGEKRALRSTLAVLSMASTCDIPFIKASRIGRNNEPNTTLFEVKGSGETYIHTGGLKIGAGGLRVAAGGQVISSGGLRVEAGGIQIDAGRLTLRDGFKIERGGLYVRNNADNAPTLRIVSDNERFSGSLFDIDISTQTQNTPSVLRFDIMHVFAESPDAKRPRDTIFKVQSDGSITTIGDLTTRGKVISQGAIMATKMIFSSITIMAGDIISIPSSHSYVKIQNDGKFSLNQADIDASRPIAGQFLIVQNDDDEAVDGSMQIRPASTAVYIYDGLSWQEVPGIQKDNSALTDVRKFEAANDLDIGNVKFSASRLQAAGNQAGRVAFYGEGGELIQDNAFQYDTTRMTLRVESLEVKTLEGEIDLSQSELHAVEIVGGHISHVNLTSINTIEVEGELVVDSSAYFGDGITVDGQVMGSGAYVDASDFRFKTNITYLTGKQSLRIISQLYAAEYNFKDAIKWNKTHRGREIGFIAQEVEKVLPQVVTEDTQGYKYVAYTRIIPVLTEGIKDLEARVRQYEMQMDKLRLQVERLEHLLMERASH